MVFDTLFCETPEAACRLDSVQAVFDVLPVGCIAWDNGLNLQSCNEAMYSRFGFESAEAFVGGFESVLPKTQPCGAKSSAKVLKALKAALKTGNGQIELLLHTAHGESVFMDVALKRIGENGNFAVIGVAKDITEYRKEANDAHENEELLQHIMDNAPCGMTIWGSDFGIRASNMELMSMFGLEDLAEYYKNFHNFYPKKQPCGRLSSELRREYFEKAVSEGTVTFEWTYVNKGGESIPTEVTLTRVNSGDMYYVVSYIRDMRRLKIAHQEVSAMHDEMLRVQLMFEATPLIITFFTIDSTIIDCNNEAVRLFEMASKADYIKNFKKLMPEIQPDGRSSQEVLQELRYNALNNGIASAEFMRQKLNGEPIPMHITVVRIEYRNDFVFVGYSRDLREYKEIQRRESETNARARILMSSAPIGIGFWDSELKFIDCNQALLDMLVLKDRIEFVEKLFELSPKNQPDGMPTDEKLWKVVHQTLEQGMVRLEWLHVDTRGELVPTEKTFVRINQDDKTSIAIYTRDLRELKNSMEREREASERVQMLYDATPYAVNFFSDSMMIVDCNQEAVKMFGMASREEYLEKYNLISPQYQPNGESSEDLAQDYVYTALNEGFVQYEWMHQKLDGTPMPCDVILVRVMHRGSYMVAGYARDLREIKALQASEEEAQERNRMMIDAMPLVASF
ncbi:MAG: PAS domain-containing protein, partial [Defluviitaleaceae bacterium]|nr:PAS domain-containing protein [Defluviitaleaceae bacterium]